MERTYPPVKDPHASTADLLTWTEGRPAEAAAASTQRSHDHWPAGKMTKVLYGGQATDEETETLNKKKPCSGYKLKEMNGSGIFAAKGSDGSPSGTANKTSVRTYQQAMNGMSQISFSTEEIISPKKPTSLPEVAKQRELSGTLSNDPDMKSKKQPSNAKFKEISGHDIFAPSPEILPRTSAVARTLESKETKHIEKPRNIRTSVKVSNPAGGQSNILFGEDPVVKSTKKIHNQKFQELTGNDIFKGVVPPGSAEKPLSSAKLKEISGSNIFADGKSESRDYFGGVRQSPGGNSSIALL